MSFYPELDGLSLTELLKRFRGVPPPGEQPSLWYQEVCARISEFGPEGLEILTRELETSDESRLRGLLFALGRSRVEDPMLRSRLRSYLADERPMVIAEAIDALHGQQAVTELPVVLALRGHASPYVRGAVLRFARYASPETARSLLIEALNDPEYIVRENALDELGELGAVDSIPHLYPALADSHPDVRQAAETAIAMLKSEKSNKSE